MPQSAPSCCQHSLPRGHCCSAPGSQSAPFCCQHSHPLHCLLAAHQDPSLHLLAANTRILCIAHGPLLQHAKMPVCTFLLPTLAFSAVPMGHCALMPIPRTVLVRPAACTFKVTLMHVRIGPRRLQGCPPTRIPRPRAAPPRLPMGRVRVDRPRRMKPLTPMGRQRLARRRRRARKPRSTRFTLPTWRHYDADVPRWSRTTRLPSTSFGRTPPYILHTCTLPRHAGTHSWWVYTHQEMGKKEQAAFAQNNKHLGVAAMRTALESFRHEFRAERTKAHIGKAMIFEQIVKELGGNEAVAKRCPQLRCQWPNPQPVATCSIKIRGSGTAPTSRNIIPTGSSPAAPCMARPPGGTARPCSRIHMGRQSSTAKWSTCPRARPQQAHLKFGICCPRVRVRLCSWGTGARH